jgi:hypothetical protein
MADVARRYPPQPWGLTGSIHTSAWLVPLAEVHALLDPALPTGYRPLTLRGRALVGAAFAHYAPGGVLTYQELLLAVVVRRGLRPAVTIPAIWVTSAESLAGGRELWAIPKHRARFERSTSSTSSTSPTSPTSPTGGAALEAAATPDLLDPGPWPVSGEVASVAYRRRALVPGFHRFGLRTAQRLDGRDVITRFQGVARLGLGSARWSFAAEGPFAMLAGRRPLVSLELSRLLIAFGVGADGDEPGRAGAGWAP